LLILAGVEIPDVFAVDLEHAYDYRLRDQVFELLLLFQVFIDVVSQIFARNRVLDRIFLLDVLVWVKAELLAEGFEGLNIIVERLDGAFDI
jgi:hypothetical protein